MKIANVDDRAYLIREPEAGGLVGLDIAEASGDRFSSSVEELLAQWDDLAAWAAGADFAEAREVDTTELGAPVKRPAQVFAIGMNYKDHAAEVSLALPETPAVFTKFASSLTGADVEVALPGDEVDWEVELVAVISRGGRNIDRTDALSHVAGYMVGQDLSERHLQFLGGGAPQFSLAKSYAGFAPVGPWITSSDEVADSGVLNMSCVRGDEVLQLGNTRNLVFDLPFLIEHLSSVVELLPGDLIFTGTPDGVGYGRDPQSYLVSGDVVVSRIEGLGAITQRFV